MQDGDENYQSCWTPLNLWNLLNPADINGMC